MLTLRCSVIGNDLVLVKEEVLTDGDTLLLLQKRSRSQPGSRLRCLCQALLRSTVSGFLL